jgi:hypothetical protein
MFEDFQTQKRASEVQLEKVVLDTRIQRAVIASQRLERYDSELSEMQEDIAAYRRSQGREPIFFNPSGRLPKVHPSKKLNISVPEQLAKKLYAWFSGR